MPTNLDFNSSKKFRDKILSKTLPVENGPLSQTADTYRINNTTDYSNIDQPPVDADLTYNGQYIIQNNKLIQTSQVNLFKPNEYFITEELKTLPRRANLSLYPYFTSSSHSYIGILTNDNFVTESELMKFAAWNIKENSSGPFFSRVQQNLEASTIGRIRLIDALNGNTATAVNIVTGKEALIESNNKISVSKTVAGKGVDFLKTVTGVEFPWSEIPGDYLSNPEKPINNRRQAKPEAGKIFQDVTGALGSLIGIQRNPKHERKPSDLFIEYMGSGQKQMLYDNLSYSKYAPNYTTTARSQNSSKVFNFVDSISQNINKAFGLEAPEGMAYIGDDRGNDVKYAMSDFNDRPVRSPYYLSLLFDPIQTKLFQRQKNISEGGSIGGALTWISSNSKNKLGANNKEWSNQKGGFEDTKSSNNSFREDSILGYTQEILDTLPANGGEMRSHVANVIDQTSRIFKDGDILLSRGSAIQYVDKIGQGTGVEYCRVWTKDRSYMNYSDTMKRTANIRKFDGSVLGGQSRPWNINIAPMSDGTKNNKFPGSTNIVQGADGFYAKKYMFSIENLAWKSSNIPGFTYNDLPYCERGNNGGRVMWFPPYDLKVQETNSAKWDSNVFLGRPEPIYTYQNTERYGTVSFKVIVDHPSILNLLVKDHFKGMSDEDADNYINAFFAGCEEIDFYDLIQRYSSITPDDITLILDYLNKGKDVNGIENKTFELRTKEVEQPPITESTGNVSTANVSTANVSTEPKKMLDVSLKFLNDEPEKNGNPKNTVSPSTYKAYYDKITRDGFKDDQIKQLSKVTSDIVNVVDISTKYTSRDRNNDLKNLFNKTGIYAEDIPGLMTEQNNRLGIIIEKAKSDYTDFKNNLKIIQEDINSGNVEEITIHLLSSTSAIADVDYNHYLSIRRSHSVLLEIFDNLCVNGKTPPNKWSYNENNGTNIDVEYDFNELGFTDKIGKLKVTTRNEGEGYSLSQNTICGQYNFVNKDLRKLAPVAFECRQTQVSILYTKKTQKVQNIPPPPTTNNPTPLYEMIPTEGFNGKRRRPPIDAMKNIIMKTLSECHYFKKLEETDPVVFSSLKEKFKYFHPSFHSMTPEGLNSRLTFLLQCVRPGDTIPVKGVDSSLDFKARNTSFGPPPICVLRVGDFYHSKIIIKDVTINYEDTVWDMNPEGIGIQPMIANVTLQVYFIGGQGLEKPVDQLQNALSSNFFANTEMYDPRSIRTNEYIGGQEYEKFTEDFLNKINDDYKKGIRYVEPNVPEKTTTDVYIGTLTNNNGINYDQIVENIFDKTKKYVSQYQELYNKTLSNYGKNISSIFLSPKYRIINEYDVYTTTTTTKTINLFGLYGNNGELFNLANKLQDKLLYTLNNDTLNILEMFGFDKIIPTNADSKATRYLKDYLTIFIKDTIDKIKLNQDIKDFEEVRDDLIINFDRVNFIVNHGYDAKLSKDDETKATKAELSGFTYNMIYKEYSSCIDYIEKNSSKFYTDIETTINYDNPVEIISNNDFKKIISELLYSVNGTTFMKEVFSKDEKTFDDRLIEKLTKTYNKFVDKIEPKKFKNSKFVSNNKTKLEFGITESDADTSIIEELKKLNTSPNSVTNKLNFYRK